MFPPPFRLLELHVRREDCPYGPELQDSGERLPLEGLESGDPCESIMNSQAGGFGAAERGREVGFPGSRQSEEVDGFVFSDEVQLDARDDSPLIDGGLECQVEAFDRFNGDEFCGSQRDIDFSGFLAKRILGDPLEVEIREKQSRSIKCRMTTTKLPSAKELDFLILNPNNRLTRAVTSLYLIVGFAWISKPKRTAIPQRRPVDGQRWSVYEPWPRG